MAIRSLLVALAAVALALGGCSDEEARIDGSGYSYSLPDGWEDGSEEISEIEDKTGVTADSIVFGEREDDFTTNVNVIREDGLPARMTAAEYGEISIAGLRDPAAQGAPPELVERLESAGPIGISAPRPDELGGEEAVTWQYRSDQAQGETRVRQVAAVKDGAGYTVTLTASSQTFDEGAAALDEVVDSWEWE